MDDNDKELMRIRYTILRRMLKGFKGFDMPLKEIKDIACSIEDLSIRQLGDIHYKLFKHKYRDY